MNKAKKKGIILFGLLACISMATSSYVNAYSFQDNEKAASILYIVDGKEMDAKEVDKLDMNEIEKLEYVKEKSQIKKYTDKEVETVVIITTKKKAAADS